MRVQSPLSNISDILKQTQNSAALYQSTLKKNEAATRAVLVDPILRALGWDTANTFMVEVEKTDVPTKTRVDYALYDSNNTVQVVVEAKSLGSDLHHPDIIKAIIQYAYTYGTEDIYVTDGIIWHHYTSFRPGSVTPSKALHIAQDDPIDCAAYLVQRLDAAKYWPEAPDIDALQQQINQLDSALSTLQQEVAQLRAAAQPEGKKSSAARSDDAAATLVASPTGPVDWEDLDRVPDVTGTKPNALRLPDGRTINVKSWLDVLRECCKFVLSHNPSVPLPFPDKAGKKVNLINTVRPPKGISSVEVQYHDRPVYLYLNYDANNHVRNALHVLTLLGAGQHWEKATVSYK